MVNLLSSNAGTTVLSVLLAILILLAMITIHEFGHYLSGKILGFKINEFAIGFGPAIFKRRNKKNGQLFSVRAFPLGGYCAFEGEEGSEEEKGGDGDRLSPSDPFDGGEEGLPTERRAAERSLPNEREAVGGSPAERNGSAKTKDSPRAFTDQPPWKRIIVLVSGALMNYLLALLLIIIGFFAFGQAAYKVNAVVASEEYPAEYSLADGDVILAAEGKTVYLATDLIAALNGKSAGDTARLTVERGGATEEIVVVLRADCDFENSSQTSKIWRALGADTREEDGNLYWDISSENCRFGFFETLGRSFGYSFRMAGSIFKVLGELLTGNLGISAIGGPVTTIKVTGQMAVQGAESFLQVAAYIGVNLAVFNLLPVPALDGSKVVFCLIEWIFRKPVPRKIEAVIHTIGLALIFGFAVLVDVLQFTRCG